MSPSDIRRPLAERYKWLAFPLAVFAASRLLLLGFSWSAPLFSGPLSANPAAVGPWVVAHSVWAALAHGEIGELSRIARIGYATVADAPHFPLLAWLSKGLVNLGGSHEAWLVGLAWLAGAAGFAGVYRVFELLRGPATARCGLALLAAFPFAYHLTDGGALAALLAFSAWGIFLGLRGSWLTGALVLSLGVLAHPACVAAVAIAMGARPKTWRQVAYVVLPLLLMAGWLLHLRTHFGPAVWLALWPEAPSLMSPWLIMVTVFGGGVAVGIVLMGFERDLRLLALAATLQLVMVLWPWTPSAVHALAVCWLGFLPWADLLARRSGLRIPALAILATHQGLLLLCFVRYLISA